MKNLLDLEKRIAVIEYYEDYTFPCGTLDRYNDLHSQYFGYKTNPLMTDEVKTEWEALKKTEGTGTIGVNHIKIFYVTGFRDSNDNDDKTTYINGYELAEINKALDELREKATERKTTLDEYKYSNLPF